MLYGYARIYDPTTGRLLGVTVNAAEAPIVRRIFAEHHAGASYGAIARGLNADGVPTKRGGTAWTAKTVQKIVHNEATYRGGVRGHGPERWPSILDDAD